MSEFMTVIWLVLACLLVGFFVYPRKLRSVSSYRDETMSRRESRSLAAYEDDIHVQYTLKDTEFQSMLQGMLSGSEVSVGDKKIIIPANAQAYIEYECERGRSELEIKIRWKKADEGRLQDEKISSLSIENNF
jgi:hypothetical protein